MLLNISRMIAGCLMVGFGLMAGAQQDSSSRPLRLIVPFSPGGGNDQMARLLAPKLGENLRQTVVVDNRPGAGTIIGTELLTRAAPDGYTMLMISTGFTSAPSLRKELPYDPIRDFVPLTRIAVTPAVLVVNASISARSVKELIALAKSRPGKLTYGSAGVGTQSHLSAELFKYMSGVDFLHVPYKGSSLVTVALLGGEVEVGFSDPASLRPHLASGKLVALAVTTGQRSSVFPQLPTIAEAGVPGYENSVWYGMALPAGTPSTIVRRIHEEFVKVLGDKDIKGRIEATGSQVMSESPQDFADFIKKEIAKWARVIKQAGIQPS